jgi:DNA-binding CsgD family transcriptional regulator
VQVLEEPGQPRVALLVATGGPSGQPVAPDAEGERALSALTRREREIALLAAEGFLPLNIAASLGIGEATVRTHLKRIYAKLGVSSRLELVRRLGSP